ncbi:hypothetical protein VTJ83DRAFT_1116 [Remersonia thermophila]|uniref:SET domain-containing protein n=1 Tax=Remersonia thermophila TaxID=72144 RepID=A0ABR4DN31_9PEZI
MANLTPEEASLGHLLERRQQLTDALASSPYDLILYLERAVVYSSLAYPDLAASDAYRALLLADEVRDEGFEYHEEAKEALASHADVRPCPAVLNHGGLVEDLLRLPAAAEGPSDDADKKEGEEEGRPRHEALADLASVRSFQILSRSLLLVGCLRSALEFCERGLAQAPRDPELSETRASIEQAARRRLGLRDDEPLEAQDLPDRGAVRREVYPWNAHEPDRFSDESLAFLNEQLAAVAPKLEAGGHPSGDGDGDGELLMCNQLGLFAKEAIAPGEVVLDEYSLLTANNRHKESACDACGTELSAAEAGRAVGCPECDDTIFCDDACLEAALARYHPAVCDMDVDSIAKDPEAKDADESLYVLLLARLLAMAAHQEVHPLEVKEIKYIWGDFLPSPVARADPTLPFTFTHTLQLPLHILERMDVDVYATLARHDQWVLNTCLAKFRGTASARKNPRDGRPDLAAVHPLWCLANHDCDPNVTWRWEGGRMVLKARETRVVSGEAGGLRAGDEVLNHYCDVDLPVRLRREWASGSLGGLCMCARCQREAKLEEEAR